jgi:uncharacterized membrane protein (DUF106 family)
MIVITKLLTNQKEVKKIKNEMNFFKEKMNKAKKSGDVAKAEQYMNDMLKSSNKQLKHSLKPMMFSFIIFITAFQFFGAQYADLMVTLPVSIPFIGAEVNWFWWYLIVVMPSSIFLRKFFDIQ